MKKEIDKESTSNESRMTLEGNIKEQQKKRQN